MQEPGYSNYDTPYDSWKSSMYNQGRQPIYNGEDIMGMGSFTDDDFKNQFAQMLRNQGRDPNTTEQQLRDSGWKPTAQRDTGDSFLSDMGMLGGMALGAGGLAGAFGGMGGLTAADIGGGMMPEFGSSAGYAGGMGANTGMNSMFNGPESWMDKMSGGGGTDFGWMDQMSGGPAMGPTPQGGGGLLDWVKNTVSGMSNPVGNNPFNITGKDIFGAGANYFMNKSLQDRAMSMGNSAANRGDALMQPQRFPFQQAANDMVQNPDSYFQNNPFAKSMGNFYKNNVIPSSIAKSGNTGFDTDRLGAQFATAVGGNYNELLNTLMGYGGFNQSPSYSGTNALAGNLAGLKYGAEANRGIMDTANKIFGSPDQPKQPQANPVTGSYTMVQ